MRGAGGGYWRRWVGAVAAAMAGLLAQPGTAGLGVWTSQGPDDGGLSHLQTTPAAPDAVIVGSMAALFRSNDAGLSWVRLAPAQDLGFIQAVLISPIDANRVYVVNGNGVLRSTNGGSSFSASTSGLPALSGFVPRSLALMPGSPDTLLLTSATHGAFRSTDGGLSWTATGVGQLPPQLGLVAFDPSQPGRVLVSPCLPDDGAAYTGAAMYRSTDGGVTFSAVTVSDVAAGYASCAGAMAFSPVTPGVALASEGFGPFNGSHILLRSTDGGASFARMDAVPGGSPKLNSFDYFPGTAQPLWVSNGRGALLASSDEGLNLVAAPASPVLPGPSPVVESQKVAMRPGNPAIRYFISRAGGLFRSIDSGASWSRSGLGIRTANIRALALNPSHPGWIYAGRAESDDTGVAWPFYRSADGGTSWAAAGNGFSVEWLRTVLVDPNTSATLGNTVLYGVGRDIAPVTMPIANRVSGVVKSTDNGNTWVNLGSFAGLGGAGQPVVGRLGLVRSIVADRSVISGGAWARLYLTNTGQTSCTTVGGPVNLVVPRVWRTQDAGATWNTIATAGGAGGIGSDGLPLGTCIDFFGSPNPDSPVPVPLLVDHADPQTLYVGTFLPFYTSSFSYTPQSPNGVFKSTDGGVTWAAASTGLPLLPGSSVSHHSVLALVMDPGNRNVLYAAANPFFDSSAAVGNVYKTTNGGASWSVAGTGLAGQDIRALLIDPANPLRVYAASGGNSLNPGGVYVSEDGGNTWNSISAGLPLGSATALALDASVPATPTLLAGTRTGVYAFTRVPDEDGDGAPTGVEVLAPNGGDGNGDGIADSQQSQVASLNATAGASARGNVPFTVSLTPLSGTCSRLYDVIAVPGDTFAADPAVSKDWGAFRFEIADCSRVQVSLRLHGGAVAARTFIRAFGPRIQGDPLSLDWNSLEAQVSGDTIRFVLQDNQPGDARQDSQRILFQGGPAFESPLFGNGFE